MPNAAIDSMHARAANVRRHDHLISLNAVADKPLAANYKPPRDGDDGAR